MWLVRIARWQHFTSDLTPFFQPVGLSSVFRDFRFCLRLSPRYSSQKDVLSKHIQLFCGKSNHIKCGNWDQVCKLGLDVHKELGVGFSTFPYQFLVSSEGSID